LPAPLPMHLFDGYVHKQSKYRRPKAPCDFLLMKLVAGIAHRIHDDYCHVGGERQDFQSKMKGNGCKMKGHECNMKGYEWKLKGNEWKMKGNKCKMKGMNAKCMEMDGKKQTYYVCYGINSFVSYDPFTRNWLQGMHIEYSTALHTHLLRNIFANSDVECILRAKTLQLNLTGAIG